MTAPIPLAAIVEAALASRGLMSQRAERSVFFVFRVLDFIKESFPHRQTGSLKVPDGEGKEPWRI